MKKCNCGSTESYVDNQGIELCTWCGDDWSKISEVGADQQMCEMFMNHKKLTANHTKLSENQLIDIENLAKY